MLKVTQFGHVHNRNMQTIANNDVHRLPRSVTPFHNHNLSKHLKHPFIHIKFQYLVSPYAMEPWLLSFSLLLLLLLISLLLLLLLLLHMWNHFQLCSLIRTISLLIAKHSFKVTCQLKWWLQKHSKLISLWLYRSLHSFHRRRIYAQKNQLALAKFILIKWYFYGVYWNWIRMRA